MMNEMDKEQNTPIRHVDRELMKKEMNELILFVASTMIQEIICNCGNKNKVRKEWLTGLVKDECSACGEELPLNDIFGGPSIEFLNRINNDKIDKIERVKANTEEVFGDQTKDVISNNPIIMEFENSPTDLKKFNEWLKERHERKSE